MTLEIQGRLNINFKRHKRKIYTTVQISFGNYSNIHSKITVLLRCHSNISCYGVGGSGGRSRVARHMRAAGILYLSFRPSGTSVISSIIIVKYCSILKFV